MVNTTHQDLVTLINTFDKKQVKKIVKRIKKFENMSNDLGFEISNYITSLLGSKASASTSVKLRSFLDVCNDIERMGDIYSQIGDDFQRKKGDKIWFTPQQRTSLNEISEITREAIVTMNNNITIPNFEIAGLTKAKLLFEKVSYKREQFRDEYLQNQEMVEENIKGSIIYVNIMTLLQSLNTHILHVSEALSREM